MRNEKSIREGFSHVHASQRPSGNFGNAWELWNSSNGTRPRFNSVARVGPPGIREPGARPRWKHEGTAGRNGHSEARHLGAPVAEPLSLFRFAVMVARGRPISEEFVPGLRSHLFFLLDFNFLCGRKNLDIKWFGTKRKLFFRRAKTPLFKKQKEFTGWFDWCLVHRGLKPVTFGLRGSVTEPRLLSY